MNSWKRFRESLPGLWATALLGVATASVAATSPLLLTSVDVDAAAGRLHVHGENFGRVKPTARFAGMAVPVLTHQDTVLTLSIPFALLKTPGTYLLSVSEGPLPEQNSSLGVTVGQHSPKSDTGPMNVSSSDMLFGYQGLQADSDFGDDDEGWTVVGDAKTQNFTPDYNCTCRNPDGFISAEDSATGGTWYFQAPAKYLGDHGTAYDGFLEFELRTTNISNPFDNYDLVLVGGGKVLVFNTPNNPTTTAWTSYRVQLNETAGWKIIANENVAYPADFSRLSSPSQTDFKTVLGNLTRLRIRGEFNTGEDTGALDKVRLGTKYE